jgi:hypothetical protein
MDSNGSETRERYEAFGARIVARCQPLLVGCPELEGFWNRWFGEHRRLIEAFVAGRLEEEEWAAFAKSLLSRRERLISALAQGLRRNPSMGPEGRSVLREMLREHDEVFAVILAGIQDDLRNELVKTNTARKAIGAYAKAASILGEY